MMFQAMDQSAGAPPGRIGRPVVPAQEVELKLEPTLEAADMLIGSDLLPTGPAVARLRSIYFDTPGQDLRKAGFTLRIRESGGRRIQTVKAAGPGAAGLFARPEWEQPVEDDRPLLDVTTPLKALLGDNYKYLGPAFEVLVERRTWMVSWEDATIELVLDRGEVVAGDRRSPLCEIELELKRGSTAALFSFARRIDIAVPLRLGLLNKAERGYRLLGPAARAVKTEPVALTPDVTTAAAFHRIAGACLRQFRLNEALIDPRDGEAVHQARVALRRLRSAFTIHKAIANDGQFDRLREELRWLAAELGTARGLDVLIARCDAGGVRERLEQARQQAYGDATTVLASARARALMLDLSEWLVRGDWLTQQSATEAREQRARDFAASALDRFRKKVRKRGRDLVDLDDATRHELRKDAKKLRYAAEFFAPLFQTRRQMRRYGRFLETLEKLQDELGLLNDAVSTPRLLARVGLDRDPGAAFLITTIEEKAAMIEAAAEAHDAFADTKRFWR